MPPFAAATPSSTGPSRSALAAGQLVHVNHRGTWLAATVRAVGGHYVAINYITRPGLPLSGAVGVWAVRPAAGVLLKRIDQIRSGDAIATYDGLPQTVTAAWPGRDRTFTIAFTGGEYTTVPAGTVLRVTDTTPRVTVNGRLL